MKTKDQTLLEEAYLKINEMNEDSNETPRKEGLIEDYIQALTNRSEASGDDKLAFAMNFVRSTLEALVEDAYGYETLRDDIKKLRA